MLRVRLSGVLLLCALWPSVAVAQTAYHLHAEVSHTSSLLELRTAGPDVASVALRSQNLRGTAPGEKMVRAFETPVGVPGASGVIPAGAVLRFQLWMRKSANVGVLVPRAKASLDGPTGPALCTVTGAAPLTMTLDRFTLACRTAADVTLTPVSRVHLWVGVNVEVAPTATVIAELGVEGILTGRVDSRMALPAVVPAPIMSGLTPSSGVVGRSVTVTGANFGATQGTSTLTFFNGVIASPTAWSATTITAAVPAGAASGSVVVTVGGIASRGVAFTVPVLTSVAVTPATASAATGTTQPFVATGTYSDGSTLELTAAATWTSSNAIVAAISNDPGSSGLASGLAAGTSTITATAGGISGTAALTVSEPPSDTTPPSISAILSPAPNAAGWHNTPVTVTFRCADASGIATCPNPMVVDTEGAGIEVRGTATDVAGNASTASVIINLDRTPAILAVGAPVTGSTTSAAAIQVETSVEERLSGAVTATCNGAPATLAGSRVTCTIPLLTGANPIVVHVMDAADNGTSIGLRILRTAALSAIVVTPTLRALVAGETAALRASDQTGLVVADVAWTSSDPTVASVLRAEDGSLLVRGEAPGTAAVTASLGGLIAEMTVTVFAGPLLPIGTAKWTFAPPGGAFTAFLAHQESPDDPEQIILGLSDVGTPVARAVNQAGEQLWTEPLPHGALLSDTFGGVVSPISRGDGSMNGLARVGGPNSGLPWEYRTPGTIDYQPWTSSIAQGPDGTVYLLEWSPGTVDRSLSLVGLDGRTGRVKARVSLPSQRRCTVWPTQSPEEFTMPYVGTDGAAYVGAVVLDECLDMQGQIATIRDESKVFLLRMDGAGASSLRMIRSYDDVLVCPPNPGCTGTTTRPRLFDVKPDGQGGMLVSGADSTYRYTNGSSEGERRPWILRIDAGATPPGTSVGGAVAWRSLTAASDTWFEMIGRDGTVYMQDSQAGTRAAYDATTGEVRWSVPVEGEPLEALPNGELLVYDVVSGAMTRITSTGQRAETDIFPSLRRPVRTAVDEIVGSPYDTQTWEVLPVVAKYQTRGYDTTTVASRPEVWDGFNQNAARSEPETGIFAKGHAVGFPFYHVAIRIVPKNQAYWRQREVERLGGVFTQKLDRLWYATVGAGPTRLPCDGFLASDTNRARDVNVPPTHLERLAVPQSQEDIKIGLLLDRDARYNDARLRYACLPDFPLADNTYNSNSFARGLLNASGLPVPAFPSDDSDLAEFPGWEKPVPSSEFD